MHNHQKCWCAWLWKELADILWENGSSSLARPPNQRQHLRRWVERQWGHLYLPPQLTPPLPAGEDWKIEWIIENITLQGSLGISIYSFAQRQSQRLTQRFSIFSHLGVLLCPCTNYSIIYSVALVKLAHCFLLSLMRGNEIYESTSLRCSYIFLDTLK